MTGFQVGRSTTGYDPETFLREVEERHGPDVAAGVRSCVEKGDLFDSLDSLDEALDLAWAHDFDVLDQSARTFDERGRSTASPSRPGARASPSRLRA